MGLFVLFATIISTSAAVSGSPMAKGTLLDETSCQDRSLETLGHYLPDPRAATRQEHKNMDKGGRITRDRCFVWVRSGLRCSQFHLQTNCTGQLSAPALCLSGQAETGRLAQGGPPPTDSVQYVVRTTWRQVAGHERASAVARWGHCRSGLGCGNKTRGGGREEEGGGEEGASARGKGTWLFHCYASCPPCHPSVLGRDDPPPKHALSSGHASGILRGGVSCSGHGRVPADHSTTH